MRLALLILVLLVGSANAQTPIERAKATIDTQRALLDKDEAGIKTLIGTFAPDGLLVGKMAVISAKDLLAIYKSKDRKESKEYWAINALQSLFWARTTDDPSAKPEPPVKGHTAKSTVANLVAGGRADVVWFTFDLTVEHAAPDLGGKPYKSKETYRITEVLADRGGWKVALFQVDVAVPDHWDEVTSHAGGPPEGEAFPDDGDETPLATLAVTPSKLAKSLLVEPSTIVMGSSASDRGVGAAAAKLVGGWSKLKLELLRATDITTKTWGVAVVRVDLNGKNEDQKMRMFGTVVGLPKADGSWQVVTLHYSRLQWF